MRIRHYGILSSSRKQHVLPLLHQQLESRYEYPEEKRWKQISTEQLDLIRMNALFVSNSHR